MELTPQPQARNLRALQDFQLEHDKVFHPSVLQMNDKTQFRHLFHHLVTLVSDYSRYFERTDHGFVDEADHWFHVIRDHRTPDLLVFSLKLANYFGYDLEEVYFKRIEEGEMLRIKQ